MEHPSPGSVIDVLRNTLRRLGQTADFQQDDAAVMELKRHIIQSIAELEIIKSAAPDREPAKTAAEPSLQSGSSNDVSRKAVNSC